MYKLMIGAQQFQNKGFKKREPLFQQLSSGQKPRVLFITCSDSRLNPHLLTHSEPGQLFIHRNVGNIIPKYELGSSEAATIEYALVGLGINEIVITGHSRCGAMIGLSSVNQLSNMPAVVEWLKHANNVVKNVDDKHTDLSDEERLLAIIQENILCQIENLKTHPCVKQKLSTGELKVHAWFYKFEAGQVFIHSERQKQFLSLQASISDLLKQVALKKLISITNQEVKKHLISLSSPHDAEAYRQIIALLDLIKHDGLGVIWDKVYTSITSIFFNEFKNAYLDKNDADFIQLVNQVKSMALNDTRYCQEYIFKSAGYHHYCSRTLRLSGMFAAKVENSIKEESINLMRLFA